MKKYDGHKLCAKSRLDRFFAPNKKFKVLVISNVLAHRKSFKILDIPNVLAHGKWYEPGFTKKCDGHKPFIKSRFD
ncbi:hypothetical protein GW17_00045856 [Ensete ventricosum]|nr:hypothetical protein GW17_00045856 [Ensete ventricosum]